MPRRTSSRRVPRKRRPKKKTPRRRTRRTYRRRRKFTDNTISVVLPNLNSEQAYFTPTVAKVGSLTNGLQTSDTVERAGAYSYIAGQAGVALPAFENYASIFRYCRIKWLKVQLIPEKWMAVTLADQASGAEDGEKPRIHWINDDGSFKEWQSGISVSVEEAETFGNRVYKSRQFTKSMTFYVKPYYRLGTAGQKYNSYASWEATGTTLPLFTNNLNLWFGFTNTPTGWKYKTIITACVAFKDPYTEYVPPPLTLEEEKKDEEPTTEEIQSVQDSLAAVKLS